MRCYVFIEASACGDDVDERDGGETSDSLLGIDLICFDLGALADPIEKEGREIKQPPVTRQKV
ncbi:hypothetical protein SODALDRAFT_357220 [Sodiomyces alkalinus F11]|uniref:Uncharacterized protein n=1 Tax=Sodiomyces alkalinus (strain CBS 110278 / VKM F-3762 / F11) TaxID=1314773 RepID=A0A3N2Q3A3_SODAK|nr:hypothetical protein SODALDRAFT_357220 [Sodiomyces alkalinus F11]ROT41197.1 hypothetical protein SODALDRAFT_357220 [Sodiomyces alkalinus F11]